MSEISEFDKAVARTAAEAIGGAPRVVDYRVGGAEPIAILSSADRPMDGFVACSTVSLHRARNVMDGRDIRVEFLGVTTADKEEFPNVLASAAALVADRGQTAAPGVVFPSVLSHYELSGTVEHLLLTEPFAYEGLGSVAFDDGPDVHWLQAVPITESERRFLLREGFDALQERFQDADMEYWNLDRPSVVHPTEVQRPLGFPPATGGD